MQMVKTTSQPMHRYFNGCNCFDMNYSTTNIIMARKRGKRLSLARPRLCFGSSLIMQSLFFQEKFLLSSFLESSQHAEEQDEKRRNDILQDEVLVSGYQARRLDPMLPKNGNK